DQVFALRRVSNDRLDQVLVLVNTDPRKPRTLTLAGKTLTDLGSPQIDLLGQKLPPIHQSAKGQVEFILQGGEAFCLSATAVPRGVTGSRYREQRAQAAWAITVISRRIRVRDISPFDW